ncbi:MAG: SusC/RagA family TonB-linked outer membrane protein, partial [Chitinophagia bacterium]|nr:SusC/RagA family TonB-linked outer membrane protein [Chitinophagia bacterium]
MYYICNGISILDKTNSMRRLLLAVVVWLAGCMTVMAQTHNVVGKVLDETGQGLPQVIINVKGTITGTATDANGDFNLDVPDGKNVKLVFQCVGYNTITVAADDGQTEIRVKMVRNAKTLEGAVVTAFGLRREKREVGFNATTIGNDELTAGNNTSTLSGLQGKVAGANISSTTGGPGGSTRVVLRGEKSIVNNNNALIVVDGVITNNYDRLRSTSGGDNDVLSGTDFGNSANDLDPDEIESVTVLNGASATALYGERGAKGAVMITTKKGRKH